MGKNNRVRRTVPAVQDEELADELIARLNMLCNEHIDIKEDIGKLIEERIKCSVATAKHERIQTVYVEDSAPRGTDWSELGLLGLLNGLVGLDPETNKAGFISAEFDDKNRFIRFLRTAHRRDA